MNFLVFIEILARSISLGINHPKPHKAPKPAQIITYTFAANVGGNERIRCEDRQKR